MFVLCAPAFASDSQPSDQASEPAVLSAPTETAEDKTVSTKAVAAAAVVGIVATAGAAAMAISIAKSTSGMARQPEAAGKINSAMMLGLVFIETAIIYALIIAILIIFFGRFSFLMSFFQLVNFVPQLSGALKVFFVNSLLLCML